MKHKASWWAGGGNYSKKHTNKYIIVTDATKEM